MRVVFLADVSPLHILGGAERVVREHASRLSRRGHEVVVLCRAPVAGAPSRVRLEDVEILHVPAWRDRPWDWVIGTAWRAGAMCRALQADVFVAYQPIVSYGALARSDPSLFPLVYVFLSPSGEEYRTRHAKGFGQRGASRLLNALESRVVRRADRLIVLSAFSRRQLLARHHHLEGDRILEIPGGVDIETFRPAENRLALREKLWDSVLADGKPRGNLLLTVRNLVPRMGLENLVRAMPSVLEELPDTTLLVVGEGPLRASLEGMAVSLGLTARVRFLGYVEDTLLRDLLCASDLFLLPTLMMEGFGLVTVEALACGTPVLGTPVGATPEILEPLDPDLLLTDTSATAIARGITGILKRNQADPDAAKRLRKAARARAEAYDWEIAIDSLEQALGETVVRACPFCETRTAKPVLRVSGHAVLRCLGCGSFRRHPAPAAKALEEFYRDGYGGLFLSQAEEAGRRDLFEHLLKALGPAEKRRLLDVGAGSGLFVRMAREAGWEAEGTELSSESRARAEKVHGVGLRDPRTHPQQAHAYDVVSLINVLDQAPDPGALLDEARHALKAGGRLVLRVPNASFHLAWLRWVARGKLRRWRRFAVLHPYGLTPRSLKRWLPSRGFENVRVRPGKTAQGPSARSPMLRVLKSVVGLGRFLSLVSAGLLVWAPAIEVEAEKRAG